MSDILDELNIDYEIELDGNNSPDEITKIFFDNLGKVLEYVSDEKKETLCDMVCSNMEYYEEGKIKKAYYDFYDWNMIRLYYRFAEFHITGKEPDFNDFDIYFRKVNIAEFNDFKNNKHKYLRLPQLSLDELLDLINKNGYQTLTEAQKELLKEYSIKEKNNE